MQVSGINSPDIKSQNMAFDYNAEGSDDKIDPIKRISYYNKGSFFRKLLWSYATDPIITIWWEKNLVTKKALSDFKIVKYFEPPIWPGDNVHKSIPHVTKTWELQEENSTKCGSRGHIHLMIRQEKTVDSSIDCLFSEINAPKEVVDNFKKAISHFAKPPCSELLEFCNNDYAKRSLES